MTQTTAWKESWKKQVATIEEVKASIGQVIVGQENVVEQVLIAMLAGGHALLEGVPGLGKTLLVRTIARCLDLTFSRVQFTPDLMPADIIGTQMLTKDEQGRDVFSYHKGPIFGNLILADEINRATPKTQSALLEAMQEHTVTAGGQTRALPRPFFVLATQNPLEMEGTYILPEAQLDRFLLKIRVDFPTEANLKEIVLRSPEAFASELKPIADGNTLIQMKKNVQEVLIAEELVDFIVKIIWLSHPLHTQAPAKIQRYVMAGAGPRGVQALVQAAKARAFLAHRFNVAQEDVLAVAPAVLRHRIIRNFEAEATGVSTDDLIADLIHDLTKDQTVKQ
ncbi:MoxR family ATPase [Hazenella sp. IB182357]|uniref:MoxR family ATPase n=1 Tax=Polycladospora coralii TaxID=2771432 RepID=A0A926RUK0_9BACL|nr:MoxR family ATPase [Polycladospora coralii]MBD1372662.1 MoxR family ATPase [Polycladospora coralii]